MSDNIDDTARRFEIFVPSPKARINMGVRNRTDTGPFGYDGVSIQSDVNLFIDGNKNTLYQTGQSFCGQVGGQWRQFSNSPMYLSATANVTLAADNKVVIASGAGQGQITALDHGAKMRLVPYNELKLHYVVDALSVSLFEFFNGRHDRHEDSFQQLRKTVDFEHFFSDRNRAVSLSASAAQLRNNGKDGHQGGFLDMVWRSWNQLEYGLREDLIAQVGPDAPGEVPWLEPLIEAGIAKTGDGVLKSLKYGYASHLNGFDPYAIKKDGWVAKLHRAVVAVKRYFHVALKYGEVVTDLPVIRHAIAGMEAAGSIVTSAYAIYTAATDSFPALAMFQRNADGDFEFGGGAADEATSGMAARIGGVADSLETTATKAKITSDPEPPASGTQKDPGWRLAAGTTYRMTIGDKNGSVTDAVVVSRNAASATMQITAPALSDQPENKTIAIAVGVGATYTIALTPANTATLADFHAALAGAIPVTIATVATDTTTGKVTVTGAARIALDAGTESSSLRWPLPTQPAAAAPPTTHTLRINGEDVIVSLGHDELADIGAFEAAVSAAVGDRATVSSSGRNLDVEPVGATVTLVDQGDTTALLSRLGVGAGATSNTSDALAMTSPHLSHTGEREELSLAIDGTTIRVALDASTNLRAALDAIPQVSVLAAVSGNANGPLTITSRSEGTASTVQARVVDSNRWTFSPSDGEKGVDGAGEYLTASELIALIGSLDGVTASSNASNALVLEATEGGAGSKVEVSGNLADLVFGSQPKLDVIAASEKESTPAFSDFEAGLKTLRSWNHELQKLPEDTRNLTRPLTNALSDTLDAVSALESVVKTLEAGFVPSDSPPPEAIGLLSPGPITLGTQDRIIGNGGKGIVFISDGGTGSPDRAKFVPTEGWVADIREWADDFFSPKDEAAAAPKRSLGFRVLSDSVVDMAATTYAQLAALGRGEATAERPDGRREAIGIGIARVLGSYAAEVAGYEKVVISARSPGRDGDDAGATGGRVELLGQRVLVGGAHEVHTLQNGVAQQVTDRARIGTESLALDGLDGAEHLVDGADGDQHWIADPLRGAAWTNNMRAQHPVTTHVDVHAETQIEQVVLPFRVQLTKEKARVGVVTPEETDRRQELSGEKDRCQREKDAIDARKTAIEQELAKLAIDIPDLKAKRDSLTGVLSAPARSRMLAKKTFRKAFLGQQLERATEELAAATTALTEATTAYDDFSNDWDAKAFPLLELTEDTIRFGFVAGSGEWEDFAYMELTKDGIKMFQPKSTGVPTFDLADKTGSISDGTADTAVTAKEGKLNLKFKTDAKSGPLQWDAQGNVKIG